MDLISYCVTFNIDKITLINQPHCLSVHTHRIHTFRRNLNTPKMGTVNHPYTKVDSKHQHAVPVHAQSLGAAQPEQPAEPGTNKSRGSGE